MAMIFVAYGWTQRLSVVVVSSVSGSVHCCPNGVIITLACLFSQPGCHAVGRNLLLSRSLPRTALTYLLMGVGICRTSSLSPGYLCCIPLILILCYY